MDNDDIAEEFFEDTRLLGIVAPMKDFYLCWHINAHLKSNFRINNDLEIQLKRKNRTYYFALYEYAEPNNALVHYLYNNSYDGEYLLPELKHLDFIWLLKGDTVQNEFLQELMNNLRKIAGVQLVMEITADKVRNKAHLIF